MHHPYYQADAAALLALVLRLQLPSIHSGWPFTEERISQLAEEARALADAQALARRQEAENLAAEAALQEEAIELSLGGGLELSLEDMLLTRTPLLQEALALGDAVL